MKNLDINTAFLYHDQEQKKKRKKNKKKALEVEEHNGKVSFWGKSRYSFMIIIKTILVEMVDNPRKETETQRSYQGVWDKHS